MFQECTIMVLFCHKSPEREPQHCLIPQLLRLAHRTLSQKNSPRSARLINVTVYVLSAKKMLIMHKKASKAKIPLNTAREPPKLITSQGCGPVLPVVASKMLFQFCCQFSLLPGTFFLKYRSDLKKYRLIR